MNPQESRPARNRAANTMSEEDTASIRDVSDRTCYLCVSFSVGESDVLRRCAESGCTLAAALTDRR